MPNGTRPPKAFYDWLDANYGWTETTSWKQAHLWGEGWKTDPVYLYWEQYTPEGQMVASLGEAIGLGELDTILFEALEQGILTPEEAEAFHYDYGKQAISNEENFIDKVPEEARSFLSEYTSKKDLADRINQLGVDQRTANLIYSSVLGRAKPGELDIRGAKGRAITAEAEKERETRTRTLSEAWEPLSRNPITAEYLKDISEFEVEDYLSGENDELINKLSGMWEEAGLAQRAQEKEAREARRAEAALGGIEALGKPRPKGEWQRPLISGTEGITKAFLEETGLAKGTKLRSFLTQEFIPEITGETRGARQSWWQRMHPEPSRGGDVETEIARIQEEARRWANIAYGEGYYGEDGLKGMAEKAYKHAVEVLGEKVPAQKRLARGLEYLGGREAYAGRYGMPSLTQRKALTEAGMEAGYGEQILPPPGPDPLIARLREEDFLSKYYRKPRTGLVSRLTPAVRY